MVRSEIKYSQVGLKYLTELDVDYNEQNDTLIIIPLDGCKSCTDTAIDKLLKDTESEKPTVIFIGKNIPARVLSRRDIPYIHDSLNLKRKYQTNIFDPVRLIFKKHKIIYESI